MRRFSFQLVFLCFWVPTFSWGLNLDQAFEAVVQNNELLKQTGQEVAQAKEQRQQANSAIAPSIYLNGDYLIQPQPSDPTARQFSPPTQTTARINLKQPLFRGFREFAGVRQRERLYDAAKLNFADTGLNLYVEVAQLYLNILAIEQDLKNVKEQQQIYGDRVKELQGRSRRGESSQYELLGFQSLAVGLDAEAEIVQSDLQAARENFALATALPINTVLEDEPEGKLNIQLGSLDSYLSRVDERPDVKRANELKRARDEEVKIAKGGHWPSLDAEGNYYLKRPDGFLSDIDWDVRLTVSFPIFEGGLRFSQTRDAVARRTSGELELAKTRRAAQASIRSLYESLKRRTTQVDALKRSVDLAERNVQVLQRDYRRGLVKNIEVQTGLTDFRIARRGYDKARYSARLDFIRLNAAAANLPAVLAKVTQ